MIRRVLLVGVAGVLGLTACSSSNNGGGSTTPAGGSSPASSAASSTAPSTGTTAKVSVATTDKGKVLTGPNGHALYTYDPDTSTASNCTSQCATNWPPLVGSPSAGAGLSASDLGTIARTDGSTQVTYDGHPLYYYVKDMDAEDMYGDGVKGVWHLAKEGSDSGASSSSTGKHY